MKSRDKFFGAPAPQGNNGYICGDQAPIGKIHVGSTPFLKLACAAGRSVVAVALDRHAAWMMD